MFPYSKILNNRLFEESFLDQMICSETHASFEFKHVDLKYPAI